MNVLGEALTHSQALGSTGIAGIDDFAGYFTGLRTGQFDDHHLDRWICLVMVNGMLLHRNIRLKPLYDGSRGPFWFDDF